MLMALLTPSHITLVFQAILLVSVASSSRSELTLVTGCTCVGYNIQYDCAVEGGVGTRWRIQNINCEIFLRHSQFGGSVSTQQTCSNPNYRVIARGVGVTNGVYFSQLLVNISQELDGDNVECIRFDGASNTTIGMQSISLSPAPPPPNNLTLSSANNSQLTFNWSESNDYHENCPTLRYNIHSNCGNCPNPVAVSNVTCTDATISYEQTLSCSIIVQPVICGNLLGANSVPLQVHLKPAVVENVMILPVYGDAKLLNNIRLEFNLPQPYFISEGIDGLPIMYTVDLVDAESDVKCHSDTYLTSTCTNGVCNHTFSMPLLLCPQSTDVLVQITPINFLGNGNTRSIHLSTINQFVTPEFDVTETSSVKCKFLGDDDGIKSCKIEYGQNCNNLSHTSQGNPTATDAVVIGISVLDSTVSQYCYVLTASNGTDTVAVSGVFTRACEPANLSNVTSTDHVHDNGVLRCGALYNALSITNGIVCYSGTGIGANAVYFCDDCGYKGKSPEYSFVRTCTLTGQWNGTIPQCTCGTVFTTSDVGLYSGIIIMLMLIPFIIVTISLLYCLFAINKARIRMRRDYENERTMKIYDEICLDPVQAVHIDNNVAYAQSCVKDPDS